MNCFTMLIELHIVVVGQTDKFSKKHEKENREKSEFIFWRKIGKRKRSGTFIKKIMCINQKKKNLKANMCTENWLMKFS